MPHTAQSGEPNCRGPEAKPHQPLAIWRTIRPTPLSQEVPKARTKKAWELNPPTFAGFGPAVECREH